MKRLVALILGVAAACSGLAQLTVDEKKGIEQALYIGNLTLKDLGFARRPFTDKYRLAVVNEAIDLPIETSDALMSAHTTAGRANPPGLLALARQLLGDTLAVTLPEAPKLAGDVPKEVPAEVATHVRRLADAVSAANAAVRKATEKLSAEEQRLLLESLPQWAVEEPSIKFEFVSKPQASQADILRMIDQVDLRMIFAAAERLSRTVEGILPDLRRIAGSSTWQGFSKFRLGDMVIVASGVGDDIHRDRDARLVVDLGGNDRYLGRAGAGPGYAALLIDLAGDDFHKAPDVGPGCGLMGIGMAYDLGGHDNFRGKSLAFGVGLAGVGLFYKDGGNDTYQSETLTQGFGQFGIGLLMDTRGNDQFEAKLYAQGSARTAGLGWLADGAGDDTYRAGGLILNSPLFADVHYSFAQGYGSGYREDTGGISGGIGMLTDRSGDDAYIAETYAQAASYWFGLGSLYDAAGHDTYRAYHYAQASAMHMTAAYLFDLAGDDIYATSFGASHAIGHDYGTAVLFDRAGNDIYAARDSRPGTGNANGLGLFVDVAGEDRYSGPSSANAARGSGSLGLFVDLDGPDQYRTGLADSEAAVKGTWSVGFDQESKPVTPPAGQDPAQAPPAAGSAQRPTDAELEQIYKKATQWGVGTAQAEVRENVNRLIAIGLPALKWMIEYKMPKASRLEQRAFTDVANAIGAEGRTAVAERLVSDDANEVRVALGILLDANAKEAAPYLSKALKNKDTQRLAARMAGVAESKESVAELQLLAGTAEDLLTVLNAVIALGQIADPLSMGTAQAMITHDSLPIRKAAIAWMAKFPEALTIAKTMTLDPDERRARIGVELLAAVGSPEALEAVGPLLTDERAGVRIQALVALDGRAPAAWKQAVLDRRKDPHALVRAVAMRIDPGR